MKKKIGAIVVVIIIALIAVIYIRINKSLRNDQWNDFEVAVQNGNYENMDFYFNQEGLSNNKKEVKQKISEIADKVASNENFTWYERVMRLNLIHDLIGYGNGYEDLEESLINIEKAGPLETINPLSERKYDTFENNNSNFGELFFQIMSEYQLNLDSFRDYLERYSEEFQKGIRFCELDDYEENLSDFYNWSMKVVNYDKENVPTEYQEAWDNLYELALYNISFFDNVYDSVKSERTAFFNEFIEKHGFYHSCINRELSEIYDYRYGYTEGLGYEGAASATSRMEYLEWEFFILSLTSDYEE